MKAIISVVKFFKEWQIILYALLSISFMFLIYNIYKPLLPQEVPLFYFRTWGQPQMESLSTLYVYPLATCCILIMYILTKKIFTEDKFVNQIIFWVSIYNILMLVFLCTRSIYRVG